MAPIVWFILPTTTHKTQRTSAGARPYEIYLLLQLRDARLPLVCASSLILLVESGARVVFSTSEDWNVYIYTRKKTYIVCLWSEDVCTGAQLTRNNNNVVHRRGIMLPSIYRSASAFKDLEWPGWQAPVFIIVASPTP